MVTSPADQVELKVKWSLERLHDGNDETQMQNASYLAGIPSNQVHRFPVFITKGMLCSHHPVVTAKAPIYSIHATVHAHDRRLAARAVQRQVPMDQQARATLQCNFVWGTII